MAAALSKAAHHLLTLALSSVCRDLCFMLATEATFHVSCILAAVCAEVDCAECRITLVSVVAEPANDLHIWDW